MWKNTSDDVDRDQEAKIAENPAQKVHATEKDRKVQKAEDEVVPRVEMKDENGHEHLRNIAEIDPDRKVRQNRVFERS